MSVSLAEYLVSTYHPDCEYIDGALLERNGGEYDHSRLLAGLAGVFFMRRKTWGIHVFLNQRVQLTPTRFRIPDVCVMVGPEPQEQIFTSPPFICIEILSKDDSMFDMQERIDDYLLFT